MAVADPSQIGGGCGGSESTMTTTEAEMETDITVTRRGGGAHGPPSRPLPNVPMTKTTTAAIRRRRPPHMMLVFSRFSPKKVPFEDTTEAVVRSCTWNRKWQGGLLARGITTRASSLLRRGRRLTPPPPLPLSPMIIEGMTTIPAAMEIPPHAPPPHPPPHPYPPLRIRRQPRRGRRRLTQELATLGWST